jgi:hypothetical protein
VYVHHAQALSSTRKQVFCIQIGHLGRVDVPDVTAGHQLWRLDGLDAISIAAGRVTGAQKGSQRALEAWMMR